MSGIGGKDLGDLNRLNICSNYEHKETDYVTAKYWIKEGRSEYDKQ
jgi:uncharacterized membrane protein YukC